MRTPTVTSAFPSAHEAKDHRLSRTARYIINTWACAILIALLILAITSGKL